MARISSSDRTETTRFNDMERSARSMNEHNDCSVKAIATVCNVSYEVAHDAMKKFGRENRQGAYNPSIRNAVASLGFKLELINSKDIIACYPKAHQILKSVTTHHPKRFAKVWAADSVLGNSLIFTRGHVSAVADGELHDWAVGRALRATEVYSVTKTKL